MGRFSDHGLDIPGGRFSVHLVYVDIPGPILSPWSRYSRTDSQIIIQIFRDRFPVHGLAFFQGRLSVHDLDISGPIISSRSRCFGTDDQFMVQIFRTQSQFMIYTFRDRFSVHLVWIFLGRSSVHGLDISGPIISSWSKPFRTDSKIMIQIIFRDRMSVHDPDISGPIYQLMIYEQIFSGPIISSRSRSSRTDSQFIWSGYFRSILGSSGLDIPGPILSSSGLVRYLQTDSQFMGMHAMV